MEFSKCLYTQFLSCAKPLLCTKSGADNRVYMNKGKKREKPKTRVLTIGNRWLPSGGMRKVVKEIKRKLLDEH